MEMLNVKDMHQLLLKICDLLIANEQELCKLDSYVGDGDHGITVSRGFGAVKAELNKQDTVNKLNELLLLTGETLSETMGGAIGPVIGGIFTSMGETECPEETIDTATIGTMLKNGLENAQMIGNAKAGDRTLIDALAPAVESLEKDAGNKIPLSIALKNSAAAAKTGAENTKNMIARKGRAKFLQDKSLGYQDAGATTMYLILSAMAEYCEKN